jgi:hypothetical protein
MTAVTKNTPPDCQPPDVPSLITVERAADCATEDYLMEITDIGIE